MRAALACMGKFSGGAALFGACDNRMTLRQRCWLWAGVGKPDPKSLVKRGPFYFRRLKNPVRDSQSHGKQLAKSDLRLNVARTDVLARKPAL